MDPSTMALLESLRGQAGFNQRENSEFIAALLIKNLSQKELSDKNSVV
ncbi:hypothetical protein [Aeromonas dhakensis]